jgi:hypothetical protein
MSLLIGCHGEPAESWWVGLCTILRQAQDDTHFLFVATNLLRLRMLIQVITKLCAA